MIKFIIIGLILVFSSLKGQVHSNHMYWVNAKYARCLLSKLPCECVKDRQFIFADVLLSDPSRVEFLDRTGDNSILTTKKSKGSEASVVYVVESESSKNRLAYSIKNDSLKIFDGPSSYVFYRIPDYDRCPKIIDVFHAFNLNFLKKRFNAQQFDMNTKLGLGENVDFYCNIGLQYKNLLYTPGKCSGKWIVKEENGMINFLKFKNSCADDIPDHVDEELIFSVPVLNTGK